MNSFISEEREGDCLLPISTGPTNYARGTVLPDSNKCNVHVKYDADTI